MTASGDEVYSVVLSGDKMMAWLSCGDSSAHQALADRDATDACIIHDDMSRGRSNTGSTGIGEIQGNDASGLLEDKKMSVAVEGDATRFVEAISDKARFEAGSD